METNEIFDLNDPKFRIITEEEMQGMSEEETKQYLKDILKSFLDKEINTRNKLKELLANFQDRIKLLQTSILRFKARQKNDLFEKLLVVFEEGMNSLKTRKVSLEERIQVVSEMYDHTNEMYYDIAGEKIQMDETEESVSKSIDELYKEALEELNREIEEGNFKEVPTQKEINALLDSLPNKEENYILENFGYSIESKLDDSSQSISPPNKLTEVELQALNVEDQTRYAIERKRIFNSSLAEAMIELSKGMEEINKNTKILDHIFDLYENILNYIMNGQVDKAGEIYLSYKKMMEK